MSFPGHSTDLMGWSQGHPYIFACHNLPINDNVKVGDVVYVTFGFDLCGWATISRIEKAGSSFTVYLTKGFITASSINTSSNSEVSKLLGQRTDRFDWLNSASVRHFNNLYWPGERPPDLLKPTFILGEKCDLSEINNHTELKEISDPNSFSTIRNSVSRHIDEYAVGFLNASGGSIYWGINDDLEVTGITLDYRQQDDLSRLINGKVREIREYNGNQRLVRPEPYFHQVTDNSGNEIADAYVLEVEFSSGDPSVVYATNSNKVFLKIVSENIRLLDEGQVQDLLKTRIGK